MKKNEKLYNLIFPLWAISIFPFFWIFVIPANFIIDSLVLILGLKFIKVDNWKSNYRKSIVLVVIFGFLSDIISGILLYISSGILSNINSDLFYPIYYRPSDNIYSFIVVLLAVVLTFFLIYFFNFKFSFKKIDNLNVTDKKKLALILAIFTSPYIYLVNMDFLNSIFHMYY